MKKTFLTLVLALAFCGARAEEVEGLIVTTASSEDSFAISDIKEIDFGDDGIIVVKTEWATFSFDNAEGWQIRFAKISTTGLLAIKSADKRIARVYNADGVLVKEMRLSDIRLGELPKGLYIIRCNGNSFKVSL